MNRIWAPLDIAESPDICISNHEGISMALLEVKISFGDHDKEIPADVSEASQSAHSRKKRESQLINPAH